MLRLRASDRLQVSDPSFGESNLRLPVWREPLRSYLGGFLLVILALFFLRQGVIPAWRQMHSDFPNYYVASRVLMSGEDPRLLYDDLWFQSRIEQEGIAQAGRFSTFPPCTAYVMVLLTPFSPDTARRVWLVLNLGMLLLMLLLLPRLTGFNLLFSALFIFLSGNALVSNFVLGQLYLAIGTFTLVALVLQEQGHQRSAGCLLGLCISIKYFPVIFLPALLLRQRYQTLFFCAATMALISGFDILVFGFDTWWNFVQNVFLPHLDGQIARQGDGHVIAYQSFNSLFRNLFVYHASENPMPLLPRAGLYPLAKWATLLIVLGLTLWRFFSSDGEGESGLRHRLGLLGVTAMMMLPVSATYHLLLLLLPLSLLFAELWHRRRYRLAGGLLMLWACLGFAPLWRLNAFSQDRFWMLLHYPRLWLLCAIWMIALFGLGKESEPLNVPE